MIVTNVVESWFNHKVGSLRKIILIGVLLTVVIGGGIGQANLYFSKAHQKNENYITLQAKTEAQARGKDPCDILTEWLAEAKRMGERQRIRDIQLAQKFLGCRNKQKRQDR